LVCNLIDYVVKFEVYIDAQSAISQPYMVYIIILRQYKVIFSLQYMVNSLIDNGHARD
jgi:hypothetical protein